MRKLIIILILSFIFSSCISTNTVLKPVCRHTAVTAVLVAAEKYPTRFAVGYWDRVGHVQGQAYMNNRWMYISILSGRLEVLPKFKMTVIQYMDLDTYMTALKTGHVRN